MKDERFFLDTSYVLALLNENDDFHSAAQALSPHLRTAKEVWVTTSILAEIGDGLSRSNRQKAAVVMETARRTNISNRQAFEHYSENKLEIILAVPFVRRVFHLTVGLFAL